MIDHAFAVAGITLGATAVASIFATTARRRWWLRLWCGCACCWILAGLVAVWRGPHPLDRALGAVTGACWLAVLLIVSAIGRQEPPPVVIRFSDCMQPPPRSGGAKRRHRWW